MGWQNMVFRDETEALRAQRQAVKDLNEEIERKLALALVHGEEQRKKLREEILEEVMDEADTKVWKLQQQVNHFERVLKADTAKSWRSGLFWGCLIGAILMLFALTGVDEWGL